MSVLPDWQVFSYFRQREKDAPRLGEFPLAVDEGMGKVKQLVLAGRAPRKKEVFAPSHQCWATVRTH